MKSRRLLLVAINYWPELTGIGKYTGEMAEWLVKQGVEVRVITAPPYYPAWRVSPEYSSWRYRHEKVAGVEILRCPLWVPAHPSGLKRLLHLVSFALSSFPVTLWWGARWRPDTIFVVEPPLLCTPAVLLAAKLAKSRAWLHIQDYEVDAAFDLGILKSRRLRRWVLAAERYLLSRFDRVSTISERMLERLGDKGVPSEFTHLFPNWVELNRIRPGKLPSPFREEMGLEAVKTIVLYSGNMGEKQGLEVLIEAARELSDQPGLHFVLCGDGAARSRIAASAEGLSNILFMPLQPLERLNDLLNLADIHVLPQRADVEDLVLPSKLTNMLASGRPVVAMAKPGTQVSEIVAACGIVIRPGNISALSEAIVELASREDLRCSLGKAARRLAKDLWDKEKILCRTFGVNTEGVETK